MPTRREWWRKAESSRRRVRRCADEERAASERSIAKHVHAIHRRTDSSLTSQRKHCGADMATKSIALGAYTAHIQVRDRTQGTEPELWPSVGEYQVYDEVLYYIMSSDRTRAAAYSEAIRKHVPGRVALDIGTGEDINWASACIQAGARKAYAIEEIPETFAKAKTRIAARGLQDKVCLMLGNSLNVQLPEKVDVCVSEIIGSIGSAEGVCRVLTDARERFMKPDAVMIPHRCVTKIAAATLPDSLHTDPGFGRLAAQYVEAVLEQVGKVFDVRLGIKNYPRTCLLSAGRDFERLDFAGQIRLQNEHDVDLAIERSGRLDGFLLWINLWCAEGGTYIDSLDEQHSWLPIFLPVLYPGIAVSRGDTIRMTCAVSLSDDGIHPDYSLRGRVNTRGGAVDFTFSSPHHADVLTGSGLYARLFSMGAYSEFDRGSRNRHILFPRRDVR